MIINGNKVKKITVIKGGQRYNCKRAKLTTGQIVFNFADDITVTIKTLFEYSGYAEGTLYVSATSNMGTAHGVDNNIMYVNISGGNNFQLSKNKPNNSTSFYANYDYNTSTLSSPVTITLSYMGETKPSLTIKTVYDTSNDYVFKA